MIFKKKCNKISLIAILIIALFLIVNLVNINKYGESVDEQITMERGKITTDYFKKIILTGNFTLTEFNVYDNRETIRSFKYHPTFFATLNYAFSNIFRNLGFKFIASRHVLILLISSVGLIFLFLLAGKMFNEQVALYSLIFMIFFPRFIAHSHYNPKDIPVMVFSLIAFYFLYVAFSRKSLRYSIIGGIFTAMAITTKLDGLFVILIFFLSYFVYCLIGKKQIMDKQILLISLSFLFVTVIFTLLLWPNLWTNPFYLYESAKTFSGNFYEFSVLYFGKNYVNTELPWHYILVYLFIVTPIITLLFFIFGFFKSVKNILKNKKMFESVFLISWFLIPLLVRMLPGVTRYDGIRHVFIVVPALAIFSGIGLNYFLNKTGKDFPKYKKQIFYVVLFFIILILVKEVLVVNPYEGSYFNEGLRFFIPEHIEHYFSIEYWGVPYLQGVEWLNKNSEQYSLVCVSVFEHLLNSYDVRDDIDIVKCSKVSFNPDYVMFTTRDYFSDFSLENYKIAYSVSVYNSDLVYIYKKNGT